MEAKLLITDQEVATLLSVARSTVWAYANKGIIPSPIKIGHAVRWRLSDIQALLDQPSEVAQ